MKKYEKSLSCLILAYSHCGVLEHRERGNYIEVLGLVSVPSKYPHPSLKIYSSNVLKYIPLPLASTCAMAWRSAQIVCEVCHKSHSPHKTRFFLSYIQVLP